MAPSITSSGKTIRAMAWAILAVVIIGTIACELAILRSGPPTIHTVEGTKDFTP